MGPVLICDKSTVQALNPKELNALRRYYSLNIPPVLLVEILGDLKKSCDKEAGKREVRILANKFLPACSTVNTDFRELIRGELSGHKFPMDGRPVLIGGNNVVSPEGKRGIIFEPSSQAKALLRWQNGDFHEAEELLAEIWRQSTQAVNLEAMQRQLRGAYSAKLKLKSLGHTLEFVEDLMCSIQPELLLAWYLQDIGMFGEKAIQAIKKFRDTKPGSLNTSAPYTAYCLKSALIFHFALAYGLISTRPTNRIDLEYLYYLPFCTVFSSGDAFHHSTTPLLIQGQSYVKRDALKEDLSQLADWWDSLSPSQREQESDFVGPPENDGSLTHRMWQKLMKPGYRDSKRYKALSPEISAKMLKEFQEAAKKSTPTDQPFDESMDDCQFMLVKHLVRSDGPCICGSGKLFKDCCGKGIVESLARKT